MKNQEEARRSPLKQQKQLVVDWRLWWRLIAEMLEARGVTMHVCQLVAAEKISAAVRISSLPEQPHLNLPVPHRSLCMALQVKSGADCFTIHSVCCDEVRGSGEAASMSKARWERWPLWTSPTFPSFDFDGCDSVQHPPEYFNGSHSTEGFGNGFPGYSCRKETLLEIGSGQLLFSALSSAVIYSSVAMH